MSVRLCYVSDSRSKATSSIFNVFLNIYASCGWGGGGGVKFIAKDPKTKTSWSITQIEIFPPAVCIVDYAVGGQEESVAFLIGIPVLCSLIDYSSVTVHQQFGCIPSSVPLRGDSTYNHDDYANNKLLILSSLILFAKTSLKVLNHIQMQKVLLPLWLGFYQRYRCQVFSQLESTKELDSL